MYPHLVKETTINHELKQCEETNILIRFKRAQRATQSRTRCFESGYMNAGLAQKHCRPPLVST